MLYELKISNFFFWLYHGDGTRQVIRNWIEVDVSVVDVSVVDVSVAAGTSAILNAGLKTTCCMCFYHEY